MKYIIESEDPGLLPGTNILKSVGITNNAALRPLFSDPKIKYPYFLETGYTLHDKFYRGIFEINRHPEGYKIKGWRQEKKNIHYKEGDHCLLRFYKHYNVSLLNKDMIIVQSTITDPIELKSVIGKHASDCLGMTKHYRRFRKLFRDCIKNRKKHCLKFKIHGVLLIGLMTCTSKEQVIFHEVQVTDKYRLRDIVRLLNQASVNIDKYNYQKKNRVVVGINTY